MEEKPLGVGSTPPGNRRVKIMTDSKPVSQLTSGLASLCKLCQIPCTGLFCCVRQLPNFKFRVTRSTDIHSNILTFSKGKATTYLTLKLAISQLINSETGQQSFTSRKTALG